MKRPCDENIRKTLDMTEAMLALADLGEAGREDNGCGVIYSVMRDAAYKLKRLAESERQAHIAKGWWKFTAEERRKS